MVGRTGDASPVSPAVATPLPVLMLTPMGQPTLPYIHSAWKKADDRILASDLDDRHVGTFHEVV